jgi:hypothetical protein
MTSLLAALILSQFSAEMPVQSVTLTSDEDIWVYPHSNDPGGDPFMRIWGVGGLSVAATPGDTENFSYGYLKFNLGELNLSKELKSAVLYLTPAGKPSVSEESKEWPLEVRGLNGAFNEKTWTWDLSSSINPSKDSLFGAGVISQNGEDFVIKIDLLGKKSNFAATLADAKGSLCLGLTSRYDVADLGMKGVYKIYTRDNKEKQVRPRLELTFAEDQTSLMTVK